MTTSSADNFINRFTVDDLYLEWRRGSRRIRYQFDSDRLENLLPSGCHRITLERRILPGWWHTLDSELVDPTLDDCLQYVPEPLQDFVSRSLEAVETLTAERQRVAEQERDNRLSEFIEEFQAFLDGDSV